MQQALPRKLGESVLKPTYPGSDIHAHFRAPARQRLWMQRERDEWSRAHLARRRRDHTSAVCYLPLGPFAHLAKRQPAPAHGHPTVHDARVFALSDGPQSWRVLPGGLTRLAHRRPRHGLDAARRQQCRHLGARATVRSTAPPCCNPGSRTARVAPEPSAWCATSRAGSNLFWLGRYTERAENSLRLVRLALEALNGEDRFCAPMLQWLSVHGRTTFAWSCPLARPRPAGAAGV
jgi:hypothetical protein